MITRIILSLKKATASQGDQWNLGGEATCTGVKFVGAQGCGTTGDEIALGTFGLGGLEVGRDGVKDDTRDGTGRVMGGKSMTTTVSQRKPVSTA